MSKQSERAYIEGRMVALFSAASDVPIGYPNSNFKEPENTLFGRFTILGGKGVVVGGSSGSRVTTRYPGIVQVTFNSPDETGTVDATACIDIVKRIFELHRGRDTSGDVITFKAAEFPNSGKVAGWYPSIIKIPFYRDEIVAIS